MILFIISYLVVAFLVIRLSVTTYNYLTNPVLPLYQDSKINQKLSILIPARDEANSIEKLLQILLQFEQLPFVLEILILDDNSTDNTNKTIQKYEAKSLKIKLINGTDLPPKWLGKNWACHQLSKYAKGNYLLFMDADVEPSEEVLINSLLRMQAENLDLLSIFPDQRMVTFGEKLVVPLMHYLLLTLLPLRLVKTSKFASLSAANGQFMLFKAETYHLISFHKVLKNNVLDDVNCMKLIKTNGFVGEVLLGNNQIFCRMYQNGVEAFNGFSKNLFPGFGNHIIGFQLYFYLIFWGWAALLISGNYILFGFAACIALLIRVMIAKMARQSVIENFYLHPLQMAYYTAIGINSMYMHITKNVTWKGRKL